jgi:hypothetical protein
MMSSLKRKLPQEGTGKAGESLLELLSSSCPTDSGGGKNSILDSVTPGENTRREERIEALLAYLCEINSRVSAYIQGSNNIHIPIQKAHLVISNSVDELKNLWEDHRRTDDEPRLPAPLIPVSEQAAQANSVPENSRPVVVESNTVKRAVEIGPDLSSDRKPSTSTASSESVKSTASREKENTAGGKTGSGVKPRPEPVTTVVTRSKGKREVGKGGPKKPPEPTHTQYGERVTDEGGIPRRVGKGEASVSTMPAASEEASCSRSLEVPKPETSSTQPHSWVEVVKRKSKAKDRRKEKGSGAGESSSSSSRKRSKSTKRTTKPTREALLIRADPREYPGIVRKVSREVPDVRTKISSTRRVADGDRLLLELVGRGATAEAVETEIRNLLGEAEVTRLVPRITYVVDNLDEGVEAGDVAEALRRRLCLAKAADVKVLSLKPAFRTSQRCVVQVPLTERAEALAGADDLRVGLNRCRVKERQRPSCCFKCWRPGHASKGCRSSKDRSNLCLKCGGEGHKASLCKEKARCVLCTEDGVAPARAKHRCGSAVCLAYKAKTRPKR